MGPAGRADRRRGRKLTRGLTGDGGRGAGTLLALLLVLAPPPLPGAEAAGNAAPDSDRLRAERFDALFEELRRSDAPGGVAAVIRDGRIVHTVAYGMADLERGVAVSPGSVFEIGSVSKQFTAMCVLLLEHDGALSLDDDVRRHVPELPDYGSPITLRHLLHHTSGIRDVETLIPLAGWHYPSYYTPDQLLGLVTRQQGLNFLPGERFLYSNSGYQLLAEIVERVSGKTLRQFAEERIFEPLGMEHTVFFDHPSQVIEDRALPYVMSDDGEYRMELWYLPFAGPSGVYTNLEDLARWDANFYDNVLGGGAALIERMETPGTLAGGEATGYAAGLVIDGEGEDRLVLHGGAWMGYRAGMQRLPARRLTVIQLSNAGEIPVASGAIREIYLAPEPGSQSGAEPGPGGAAGTPTAPATVELAPELLASYEGVYWNESDQFLRTIEVRDGALHYVRREGNATELAALAPGRFVMLEVGVHVEVAFAPEGAEDAAMTVTVGDDTPLHFTEVARPDPAALAAYAGRYWSDELGRELLLNVDGDTLFASWADDVDPTRRLPATVLATDDLLVSAFVPVPWYVQDVRLRFVRDGDGEVVGSTLTCDMVRGVTFTRRDAGDVR